MRAYSLLLRDPAVRRLYVLGLLVRIPLAAAGVVLTLHVVSALGTTYSAAGVVAAVWTICSAVAQPWRGRLVDRRGLRRTLLPSLLALPLVWVAAPYVGYWPLLGLMAVAGLLTVPSFAVLRQAVMAAAPEASRRTALSLDSVVVELSFIIGPAAGVWLATAQDTRLAMLLVNLAGVAGTALLYAANPPVSAPDDDTSPAAGHGRWLTPRVLALLAVMGATTFVLAGTDVSVVAGLRALGREDGIGWVMSAWSAGSLVGAVAYGALHRAVHPVLLLLGLGLLTVPAALSGSAWSMAGWTALAGLCCAPTIASSVDSLSRAVPASRRGEAMGWHGGLGTVGTSAGAPLVGAVIDRFGWPVGFVAAGLAGVALALATGAVLLRRRRRRVSAAAATAPS